MELMPSLHNQAIKSGKFFIQVTLTSKQIPLWYYLGLMSMVTFANKTLNTTFTLLYERNAKQHLI